MASVLNTGFSRWPYDFLCLTYKTITKSIKQAWPPEIAAEAACGVPRRDCGRMDNQSGLQDGQTASGKPERGAGESINNHYLVYLPDEARPKL